jgi:hypothetical protein
VLTGPEELALLAAGVIVLGYVKDVLVAFINRPRPSPKPKQKRKPRPASYSS